MEIFSDNKALVEYDAKEGILYVKRKTLDNDDEYKWFVNKLVEIITDIKPKYIIADNKEFYYPITPELQDWSVPLLTSTVIKNGVKKIVYVESEDFVAALALEQIIDGAAKLGFKINYVSSLDDAYAYIRKKD